MNEFHRSRRTLARNRNRILHVFLMRLHYDNEVESRNKLLHWFHNLYSNQFSFFFKCSNRCAVLYTVWQKFRLDSTIPETKNFPILISYTFLFSTLFAVRSSSKKLSQAIETKRYIKSLEKHWTMIPILQVIFFGQINKRWSVLTFPTSISDGYRCVTYVYISDWCKGFSTVCSQVFFMN